MMAQHHKDIYMNINCAFDSYTIFYAGLAHGVGQLKVEKGPALC